MASVRLMKTTINCAHTSTSRGGMRRERTFLLFDTVRTPTIGENSMTTGLYLGKFAPLHKGHEHVIQLAIEECDHVIVLIYPTDVIAIPVDERVDWIRELYPSVEVLIAWEGPRATGYTDHMKALHEKYVHDRVNGRNIDRFYSSEPYGKHMAGGLDAVDCRVDPDRETVPVSGTKVRNDPEGNREYVSPLVYRDL